ncbi:MAG TPA: hypothetical protein VML96_02780, partial [Egibacteraceae bacterium]|nr:hypothetical protein [Egibacteraceae bacterium]
MSHPSHHGSRTLVALMLAGCLAAMGAASVSAHPHTAKGQVIANGQNHPPFVGGTSCEEFGPSDPAWYG